tara:strand:+ start:65 stop:565 length:501 start_codon:yes stop_codon:yes gene_type:complete
MKVFKEEQRFRQIWLIIILVICTIIPITKVLQKHFSENKTVSTKEFTAILVIIVVSILILFFIKLTTRIDEKGIHYQFSPFHFSMKLIPWNQITRAGIRTYFPISEFGGWGLKGGFFFNKGRGKAINVSGNIGVQLILKNGDKILIGTQKKEEALRVLETYKNKLI